MDEVKKNAQQLAQKRLDTHVQMCEDCQRAQSFEECCELGQVLANLVYTFYKRKLK